MNTTLEAMNATFEKLIGTPKGPPYAHTCQICGKEYENGERWDVYLACGPVCLAAVEAKEAQHAEACRLKRIAKPPVTGTKEGETGRTAACRA
jgi:hypothetical protein